MENKIFHNILFLYNSWKAHSTPETEMNNLLVHCSHVPIYRSDLLKLEQFCTNQPIQPQPQ